jgi:hypothetical protein
VRRTLVLVLCLALALPAATAAAPLEAAAAKPDITGTTLNGQKLSLKWYRGKWVFINAWASW